MCCARLPNRSVDVAREHQQSTYGALTPDDVSDRGKYIVVVDHDARGCGGGQPTPDRSGPPLKILAHHPVGMAAPVPDRRFDRSGWPALSVGRRILPDEHYICRHGGGVFHDAFWQRATSSVGLFRSHDASAIIVRLHPPFAEFTASMALTLP
jgi:hypothetical protein